jgi:hypothetical protein
MVVRLFTACAIAAEVDCMEQRAKLIQYGDCHQDTHTARDAKLAALVTSKFTTAVQHGLCEPNYICQLAKCEQNNRCGWTVGDKLTDNYVGNALVFLKVCVLIFGNYQFEICYSFTGRQSSSGTNKL